MTHLSNANDINGNRSFKTQELRLLARSVTVLALLTGLIYMRVISLETFAASQNQAGTLSIANLFALIILGMASLLCSLRWEAWGGGTAVLSAVGIGILAYAILPQYPLFSAVAYSSPFFVAGLLMLACWQRSRNPGKK